MLDIISVGPGEAVLLTDDAKQAIDRADAVWCAARHAVLVPPEKARPLSPLEGAIEQMRLSSDAGQSAAVLVSGDAGLYSLLEMLKRKIGGEYLRVHPGVSALQLFAARLGVSWQDAKILSAHGRALSGKHAVPRRADASADVLLSRRGAQSCVGAGEPEPRRAGKCAAVCRRTALLSRRADGGL